MADRPAKQPRPERAVEGEGRHAAPRPHLTPADLAILRALPKADARAFESLVRAQHKSDKQFRAFVATESELGEGVDVAYLHGIRDARWSYGTGGGRQAERHDGLD